MEALLSLERYFAGSAVNLPPLMERASLPTLFSSLKPNLPITTPPEMVVLPPGLSQKTAMSLLFSVPPVISKTAPSATLTAPNLSIALVASTVPPAKVKDAFLSVASFITTAPYLLSEVTLPPPTVSFMVSEPSTMNSFAVVSLQPLRSISASDFIMYSSVSLISLPIANLPPFSTAALNSSSLLTTTVFLLSASFSLTFSAFTAASAVLSAEAVSPKSGKDTKFAGTVPATVSTAITPAKVRFIILCFIITLSFIRSYRVRQCRQRKC